jgi:lipid-binding SYLF domain-containing protein
MSLNDPDFTLENRMKYTTRIVISAIALTASMSLLAFQPDSGNKQELDVAAAIADIKTADPAVQTFFDESAGYAIFPKVGKGGIGIGGAHGKGLVIVDDEVVGTTSLSQISIGLQLGGQVYAEYIFFKDETALSNFQRGNFELGAQVSAVAVTLGASADADYNKGVAIFTHGGGGLMYEASVGGQKFKYEDK